MLDLERVATPAFPRRNRYVALGRVTAFASVLFLAPSVDAEESPRELHLQPLPPDPDQVVASTAVRRDPPDETPKHAFIESPFNLSLGALYAGLTGTAIGGKTGSEAQGGVNLGWSPVDRLSLHAFVGRDDENKWAPVATLHFRILGSLSDRYALGAFVQYKTDGFAAAAGEVEAGVTFGLRQGHFYFDTNLLAGVSTDPDEGETDGEGRLRLGWAIVDAVRLGAEGQVRRRFSGTIALAGGRVADMAVGPQAIAYVGPLVVSATGGATTIDVARDVGEFGIVTVGAFAH